jgi:hypothetical protein
MGKAIHSGTLAEIPVPNDNSELTRDQSGGPRYQPEIEPDPASLQSPGTEPGHPDAPHIRPDIDPDIPEKPGPPLYDPENPHGKY